MTNLLNMRPGRCQRVSLLASSALLGAALATLGVTSGRSASTFLDERLGTPAPAAPLVRELSSGLRVELRADGYAVRHGRSEVGLSSEGNGEWSRFARGVARPTTFGRETILVAPRTTEQFLTVARRQGARTWRWRLHAGALTPRVNPDGRVVFHDGALADLEVEPARILTRSGRDVTPAGLRWSLERGGGGWWLTLPLDDRSLPLPYVIDPAITLRAAAASANNGGGAASLTINRPTGVAENDFLLALVSVQGGTSRTISSPTGWSLLRRDNQGTNLAQAVYYKAAGPAEPSSYQWTFNASARATGGVIPYVGVNNASPIDTSSGRVSTANSSSVVAPSVTPAAPNHRIVGFFGLNDDRTWTPPAGMTERWDTMSGASSSEAADMTQATATATGDRTATASGSQAWIGQLVALRLDAVPPAAPGLSLSESSADSHVSGTTFWYRPDGAGSSLTVTAAAGDAESGLQKVTFPGLTAGFSPSLDTDDTSSPYSATYTWTTAAGESGPQTVTAVDNAGNTSESTFTVTPDENAPTTADDTVAIGSAWKKTDQTVSLTPSGGAGESGVAATHFTTDGSNPTLASPQGTSIALTANGVYAIKYFSIDRVGNEEAVQTGAAQIRIDKTAPSSATLDALPASISDGHVLTGAGADALSGVASIAYYVCAGPPCTPSTLIGSSSSGPTFPYAWTSQPPDGLYQVMARAVDAAGNTLDSAAQTVTIENAPTTTIDTGPANPTNTTDATFTFSADDPAATFECQLDGSGFAPCTSPKSYLSLADGSHTFQARAIDAVLNVGSPDSLTWTIDRTAPNTTVDTGPADPTAATDATFTFSAGEPGSTFECQLDSGGFAPCSSPRAYAGLGAGGHVFQVRAIDAAGNTDPSPGSYGWTIDLAPPDTTITSAPAALTNATGASFSFTATEPGSTFACRLDGAAFSPCTSPRAYTGLGAGPHAFEVRATDPVGNTGSSASHSWTVDLTPPDTTITAGPPATTNSGSASFSFDASEAGSSFECQLDGAGFTPCTSPRAYVGLASGSHTFQVRATDAAGNADGTPASQAWAIDTAAPDTVVDSGPGSPTAATGATFTFSAGEPGSTFECQLDGGAYGACASPKAYSGLTGGSHTFRVRATDSAGNTDASPATYVWTIDSSPPTSTVDSGPPSPTTSTAATFSFSANELGSTFECQLDGSPFAPCSSPRLYTALGGGAHTFQVRATDAVGNTGPSTSYAWTIDLTPPDTTITSSPASPTSDTDASFSFSSTEPGSSFECQLDGGGYSACTSPRSYTGLIGGTHSFQVRATDAVGNTDASAAVHAWTIDTGAPTATVDFGPANPTASTSATFTFSSSEAGSSFQCQLDGGGYGVCTSPATYTGLAEGTHSFRVKAIDSVGNVGVAAVETWVIDRTPPDAVVGAGPANPSGSTSATFTFSANETGSTFQCQLDGGGYTSCASPRSFSGLTPGTHTFQVKATDPLGNAGSAATHSWQIDVTPPTVGLADPGSVLSGTVALAATAADANAIGSVRFERSPAGANAWATIDTDTSAPYTASFVTAAAGDGFWDLRAVATDAAGNSTASPVATRRIDNTAPAATIAADRLYIRSPVQVRATATDDGSGIAAVTFERAPRGTGAWVGIATVTSPPYAATFDPAGLADAQYDVRAVVRDGAGNTTAPSLALVVAASGLGVALTDPGATLAGTVTLSATTSGLGAQQVVFELRRSGSTTWTLVGTDPVAPWSTVLDTSLFRDGTYDLRVTTTDADGVASADVRTGLRLDNTAPALTASVPATNGRLTAGGSVMVTATEPVTRVTNVLLDGSATVVPRIAGTKVTFALPRLRPGKHTLTGRIHDTAGLSVPFTLRFSVAPSLTLRLGTPARSAAALRLRVTLSQAAAIRARLVAPSGRTLSSRAMRARPGSSSLSLALSPRASGGRYSIVVTATAAGRTVSRRVTASIQGPVPVRGGTWVVVSP